MADLVTHLCTGVIVKTISGKPHVPIFLFGTVAPDLVSRVPSMALTLLGQWGLPVPPEWVHSFEPLHLPIGILLLAALVSLLFDAAQRWSVFVNFLGGMMLHLMVDLLQDHHGVGYVLGFPLIDAPFEFGWMSSEASIRWLPVLMTISLGLVIWRRRKQSTGALSR